MSGFNFPIRRIGSGRKSGLKRGHQSDWVLGPNEMERENKIANGMIMTSEKKAKEIYWAVTARLAMMLTGVMLLAGVASNVEGITHLVWTVSGSKRMGLCGIYVQRLGASHAFYGDPFIKT